MSDSASVSPRGLFYGLAAYGLWGLAPLYFNALTKVPSLELLAHRIVWSMLLLLPLMSLLNSWPDFRSCFRTRRLFLLLACSTAFIGLNWFVYIYSVVSNQVLESSLGYFICPLVNVLLGRFILRERLHRLQWCAVFLAALGVGLLVWQANHLPWIALSLALSFAFYGLIRKLAGVNGLVGLAVESCILFPLAMAYLMWLYSQGQVKFRQLGMGIDVLLLLSGIVTAVPLLCFGQAAKLLPLSTLAFLQYISPTLQFVVAVLILGEPFTSARLISFVLIWIGILVFMADSWRRYRIQAQMKHSPAPVIRPNLSVQANTREAASLR